MEVQIISQEIIKPSAATPNHLKTYKLSAMDQLAPPVYFPSLVFYSPTNETPTKISDRLKKSLSETLTHLYPLAGRLKDDSTIDCNDDGAIYIEAHVRGDMPEIIQQADSHQLEQLLPYHGAENSPELSTMPMLAVQFNHFDCGGKVISICLSHRICDASGFATFLKFWASISRGANPNADGAVVDCTWLFPPQDLSDLLSPNLFWESFHGLFGMKRFVFDGSKVAAFREKISNGAYLDRPTRVEAMSALIWGAAIAAASEENESVKVNAAMTSVNLRNRIDPPLPQNSIGNICQQTMAYWPTEMKIDYNGLAGKLRESVRMINNEYIRQVHENGAYFDIVRKDVKEIAKDPNSRRTFALSSLCRIPFYDADFGWGKPIWFGLALRINNGAILLDTRDGEGVEAWVGLPKEEMAKFEKNPCVLAYASFN